MFETLIPKPMMQHYISLLLKHRRLVLSGPSGTGKTYLTNRLAEYLVERSGREVTEGIVSTFNMHQQSCKVAASRDPASAFSGLGLRRPCQALPTRFCHHRLPVLLLPPLQRLPHPLPGLRPRPWPFLLSSRACHAPSLQLTAI